MIAEISKSFNMEALGTKANYHQNKINSGVAEVIFSTVGVESVKDFLHCMQTTTERDERTRTKNRYIEMSLNLPHNEKLSNDKFNKLAAEYLERMGYGNCPYVAIRHEDKQHSHIHILASVVDFEGNKVSDSKNFEHSQKISRELEDKYLLQKTEYNKFNNRTLGEVKAREYYYHKALQNGLRNHITRRELEPYLKGMPLLKKERTASEYKELFGENFAKIGAILEARKHFEPLLKDELLMKMDAIKNGCVTFSDFQDKMKAEGLYMRLVKDQFVYGIPEASFYVKDNKLPQTYRYTYMKDNGVIDKLSPDLQKNYIYNNVREAMIDSANIKQFKEMLDNKGIHVTEYAKQDGIQLYYNMNDSSTIFKDEEISNRFTYASLDDYFSGENRTPVAPQYLPEEQEEQHKKEHYSMGGVEDTDNLSRKPKRRKRKQTDRNKGI